MVKSEQSVVFEAEVDNGEKVEVHVRDVDGFFKADNSDYVYVVTGEGQDTVMKGFLKNLRIVKINWE